MTELAHSKLKYGSFSRVVMTDQLKIVRVHARNVHRINVYKLLDNDASRVTRYRKAKVMCS